MYCLIDFMSVLMILRLDINAFSAEITYVRVNEGDQAFLSCHAPDSYPDRNIHWMKKTLRGLLPVSVEPDSHYTISVSGDLYFSYTTELDRGVYVCSVENNVLQRVLKKTVKLDINKSDEKNIPPQVWLFEDNIAMKNTNFMLECISYGRPIPTMKFRHCKTRKILKGAEQIGNRLRYEFGRYLAEEDGQYTCEVSNTFGQVAKKTAYIRLEAKPEMEEDFESLSVSIDSEVLLPCEAEGIPSVSYKWYFNGNRLADDSEVNIFKGNVTIMKVMMHHEGFYQCVAHNRHGEALLSIHLKVVEMIPHFGAQSISPAERTVAFIGGNSEIFCVPSGAPRPEVRWQKRGDKNYISEQRGRFIKLPSGTLKIVNIKKSDEGIYDCIASNRLGTNLKGGRLSVTGGLAITEPLTKRSALKTGQKISLVCTVSSSEDMEVAFTWKLGKRRLKNNSRTRIIRKGRRQSLLEIKNAMNRDTGNYKCEVHGAKGMKYTKVQYILVSDSQLDLTRPPGIKTTTEAYKESIDLGVIKGPPYPPTEVAATEQDGVNIKLSWTLGRDNGSPVTKIYIEGKTSYDTSKWVTLKISNKTLGYRQSEIVSLSPWAEYKMRVIAENKNGKSKASEETKSWIITPSVVPEKYPKNIKGKGTAPNKMKITFTPLPLLDQNGPGIHYVVYYKAVGMSYEMIEERIPSDQNHITLSFGNIDSYYKLYEFQVEARNDIGRGPRSPIHTAYTGERTPLVSPWNLQIKIKSTTYIEASWQAVKKSRQAMRGKFMGYKLFFWVKPEAGKRELKDMEVTHAPYATLELLPYREYYFQVLAFNSAGDGPVGETVGPLRTPEGVPSMPMNLQLSDASVGCGTLTWDEPLHKNGVLLQYVLKYYHTPNGDEQQEEFDANVHRFDIEGLSPRKEYVFKLAAVTNGGAGDYAVTSFNFSKVPSLKLNAPRVINKTEDTVVLNWLTVNDSSIIGYKIFYWHSDEDAIVLWERKVDVLDTIRNLQPGTTYFFQIAVYSVYGTGPKSDIARARTLGVLTPVTINPTVVAKSRKKGRSSSGVDVRLNKTLLIVVVLIAVLVPR